MNLNTDGILMRGVTMNFSGKLALSDVEMHIKKGTIHAIVGENGAGKSTLMNILSGVLRPTAGEVYLDGAPLALSDLNAATAHGIGMVHQHFMLIPMLKVWQNIILGVEPRKRGGQIDKKRALAEIDAACANYGTTLDPEQQVGSLTVGEQQRVEIIKVLYRQASYIILDEPTAVLTPSETQQLFQSVRMLKSHGKTVIFISHKLEEVLEISDEITVLRQGRLIGTVPREQASAPRLIEMMVGHAVDFSGAPLETERGAAALCLTGVSTARSGFGCALQNVCLQAHKGEILGIAGVDGNGQLELVETIMGLARTSAGKIEILGRDITHKSTGQIRRAGVACIPPDRHEQGLILDSSIARNAVLGFEREPQFRKWGLFLSKQRILRRAKELSDAYTVSYAGVDQQIRYLSGGNQQKVILARECGLADPEIILAVNPTRGLDIGAIAFVYAKLEQLKAQGKCILLISTELTEIVRLSDRIAVLYKGAVMGEVAHQELDMERIGAMMLGVQKERAQ